MYANHGVFIDREKICSSEKLSSTGISSSSCFMCERKSVTILSFPGHSRTVILKSCNKRSHLATRPFVMGLFMRNTMEKLYVCTNTSYPVM
jgi:hypothetical protein